MKRRDILKALRAGGFTFVEGGRHTRVLQDGRMVSVVPRHTEVPDRLVRRIERQTGVKLK